MVAGLDGFLVVVCDDETRPLTPQQNFGGDDMDRRQSARDHDEFPRKPRRKAKKQSGGAFVALPIRGGAALLPAVVGGGGVGAYVKSAPPPPPVVDATPAQKGPKPADPGGAKLTELADRFVGEWEGESPE